MAHHDPLATMSLRKQGALGYFTTANNVGCKVLLYNKYFERETRSTIYGPNLNSHWVPYIEKRQTPHY